jgi:hypothetical protein
MGAGCVQAERIVSFVSEAVAALGDVRVSVGIATGPAAVAIEVLPGPAGSAGDGSQEELCRYTATGPAVEAAQRLELTGRPGFMHLTLTAADRLGAERGLFMDLANAAIDTAGTVGEGSSAAAMTTSAGRRRGGAKGGLRHDRSVWIDCFHSDILLSADDLPAAADPAAAEDAAVAGTVLFERSTAGFDTAALPCGLAVLPEEDSVDTVAAG